MTLLAPRPEISPQGHCGGTKLLRASMLTIGGYANKRNHGKEAAARALSLIKEKAAQALSGKLSDAFGKSRRALIRIRRWHWPAEPKFA